MEFFEYTASFIMVMVGLFVLISILTLPSKDIEALFGIMFFLGIITTLSIILKVLIFG